MKALVYLGARKKALQERPTSGISAPTDAIVKITKTTICGTDRPILKGDVPSCLVDTVSTPMLLTRFLHMPPTRGRSR